MVNRAWKFLPAMPALLSAGNCLADNQLPSTAETVTSPPQPLLLQWLREHVGSWIDYSIAGAELWRFLFLLLTIALFLMLAMAVRRFLEHHHLHLPKRARWPGDEELLHLSGKPAALAITVAGVYLGMLPLISIWLPAAAPYLARLTLAVTVAAIVWFLYRGISVLDNYLRKLAERTDNELDNAFVDIVRKTLRIFILVIGSLFILQSIFEMQITALLASAGVFGLAVAFAAQDSIANIFGTVMLLTDKPFKLGDRVTIDNTDGNVEAIGLRSTRIRNLDGHLVSLPNKQVANSKIQNIARRPFIKRVSTISITYDTPPEKVARAVEILRELHDNHEGMPAEFPPRIFFKDFASYSLDIMLIAWYEPPQFWDYLAWCERINHEILRRFNAEGIEFAFPTSTMYLAHDRNRPLTVATRNDWVQVNDN